MRYNYLTGIVASLLATLPSCIKPEKDISNNFQNYPVVFEIEKVPRNLEQEIIGDDTHIGITDKQESVYCQRKGDYRLIWVVRSDESDVIYTLFPSSNNVDVVTFLSKNGESKNYNREDQLKRHLEVFFRTADEEVREYSEEFKKRNVPCDIFD